MAERNGKKHKPYSGLSDMFRMLPCATCGKEFIIPTQEWVYKRQYEKHLHYFCSYGCMRQKLREKGLI